MTLPVAGSRCGCRHCAQISFIMHCIGELIEPIARCAGLRYGASTPCRARATAAIILSEPMAMMRSPSASAIGCAPRSPRRVRAHRLDDVADERAVLRAVGREARRLVAAPDDDVGRGLDLGDLVAVDHLLVAGEVEHLRAGARGTPAPIENSTALPRPPPTSTTVSPRLDLGRRAGRAHQHDRLAGLQQRAQVGRAAHLEHDRRHEALLAVDPRAGEREAFHREARAARARARAPRSSAGGRTGRARNAARGGRRAARRPRRSSASAARRARRVARSWRSSVAKNAASLRRDRPARRCASTRDTIG